MNAKPIGNENDIAITTRVRLARNIRSLPYPRKMNAIAAQGVIDSVWSALDKTPLKKTMRLYNMSEISDLEKRSLTEKHLISPSLTAMPIPSAAIISEDEEISIMINEEDHIRLQVFSFGLDVEKAYSTAKRLEALLSETLDFDIDKDFGFLTSCPTNAGTGLRASVMLHLPAISITNNINPLLKWAANLGMTVRGLYGEGTKASGALFQLSNQITLGISEEEIISRFTSAAYSLISEERRICAELFEKNYASMTDKCLRSLGILKNAYMISSAEAMKLVSNVCLGANFGIIKNINNSMLHKTLFNTMPATLELKLSENDAQERDIKRAQHLQKILTVGRNNK